MAGTRRDPSGEVPVRIERQDGTARITQAPDLGAAFGLLSGVPSVELALGRAVSYSLTPELGGLPLQRLVIKFGAGKLELDFSTAAKVAVEWVLGSLDIGDG